jgi:hypothetical protein
MITDTRLWWWSILLVGITMGACRTAGPPIPPAVYDMTIRPTPLSSLAVPVRITESDLQRIVQAAIAAMDLPNRQETKEGFTWKMAIRKPASVRLEGMHLHSILPLDVEVFRDLGITQLRADGEAEVQLRTLFNIREDWTVQTYTTLESHRWLRSPVARVAGVNLPIGRLTQWIIDSGKRQITRAIDHQIQDNVDLRAYLTPLWSSLRQPLKVSEEMDLWFRFEPRMAGLEPFISQKGELTSTVHLSGLARIKAGGPPQLIDPLYDPQFGTIEKKEDSLRVFIHIDIPYLEAERIAGSMLVGERFTSGSKHIVIDSLALYGQGPHLIARVKTSGDYKGLIFLRGVPELNTGMNRVELRDFDFDVQTRNFLHRSAAWMFKSNLRNAFQRAMVFPLEENLATVKEEINREIRAFQPGPWIQLHTPGIHLGLSEIHLNPEGLDIQLLLSGKVEVQIRAFQ